MAIQGQKVRIACQGVEVPGFIVFGSDNRLSLMLGFEAILDGGFVGTMPVLYDEQSGVYRNIFTHHEVQIEWLSQD